MKRMKTFATYAILIIAFWVLSIFLENLALKSMYTNISCEADSTYNGSKDAFQFENLSANACNVNGYIEFDLLNNTDRNVDKCYVKVDLFNKQDQLAKTEYIEVLNLKAGESRHFNIKFKANNIKRFNLSVVEEMPDKTNIINILGWEIDLTNVFGTGLDVTNLKIFGIPLSEIFGTIKDLAKKGWKYINWDYIKGKIKYGWDWYISLAKTVPFWAYGIGWCVICGLL